ncbi:MAG: hypothetical protein QOH79_3088 [Acidimicrobiaceae bacterium]
MKMFMAKTSTFQSRAVLRTIEAGSSAMCITCDEQVKFKAKIKMQQVICNVYVDGKWDRVEHYHLECYDTSGKPYGDPAPNVPTRVSVTTAA